MRDNSFMKIAAAIILFTFYFTIAVPAQEQRVRPAFPIASGEKMLIIPGVVFDRDTILPQVSYINADAIDVNYYHIDLPVGTVLKRMVVDASDNDGNTNNSMFIRIDRVRSSTLAVDYITLRTVSTQGYNSSAFTQLVSNPMNHTMLQGWTYFVKIVFSSSPTSSKKIGVIKIIYEP